ncbi:MAG: ribonuclease P protein component [Patescibacteria group bacterium]
MLPSPLRIRRILFKDIFRKGSVFHSKDLSLFVLKDKEAVKASLFSFSASKKVSKIAPKRNKLRRQGYSVVRNFLKEVTPGFLCVFVYKKTAGEASFEDIKTQIEFLLRKAVIRTP